MIKPKFQYERGAVAGHPCASAIGADVLANGGNAVDAGVAMAIALSVLESIQVQFAGVAAIMIRDGKTGRVVTIAGLGPWPMTTDVSAFRRGRRSYIPAGVRRTVVPAAPDAYVKALELYGTWSFADVVAPAIQLARDGFTAHESLSALSQHYERYLRKHDENAKIWLPDGQPIRKGQHFVQSQLAATLQFLADTDQAARSSGGRRAGLTAVHDAFYVGEIGQAIVRHIQAEGGWLTEQDMAAYQSPLEDAVSCPFRDHTIFSCGPWSQGTVVPMAMNIVQDLELSSVPHNCAEYLHVVTEAIKLAYADREKYLGESAATLPPLEHLLDQAYAKERQDMIDPDCAWPGMPPPGEISGYGGTLSVEPASSAGNPSVDTSVCCSVDDQGNVFAATPSDMAFTSPAVPGLGFVVSTRGSQSYAQAGHAAAALPGKRPRLTATPTMVLTASGAILAAGGPGADGQPQAMLQVLLNHLAFGLDLQDAVDRPRIQSLSFPSSHEPHSYYPNMLEVEDGIPETVHEELREFGHKLSPVNDDAVEQSAVCALLADPVAGTTLTATDPRFRSGTGKS